MCAWWRLVPWYVVSACVCPFLRLNISENTLAGRIDWWRHVTRWRYSSDLNNYVDYIRRQNTPTSKKLQHFVFWWFYVRLGPVYNILKVGQIWSMGSVQFRRWLLSIFKPFSIYRGICISVNFHGESVKLAFLPRFSEPVFHMRGSPVMLNHPLYHI